MQGTTISGHNDLSASQNQFNDLLSNTIQQGKSLLSRNQIIETYVESQSNALERSQQINTDYNKTTEDLIAENAAQDLRGLNYDVVRGEEQTGPSPFKTYLNTQVEGHYQQMGGEEQEVEAFDGGDDQGQQEEAQEEAVFEEEDGGQGEEMVESDPQAMQFDSAVEDDINANEDPWTQTNASIDALHVKQRELQALRKTANGPDMDHQHGVPAHTIRRKKLQESQVIASALNDRELQYATETPLRSTIRYDKEPLHIKQGETTVLVNNDNLVNRYHTLRQKVVSIKRNTLKFAENRINPPRCLLDVLDALFSLVYGVYTKLDQNYFTLKNKRYYLYKSYLRDVNQLFDVVSHFKLYVETQGIPQRNIDKADAALVRYYKSVKRVESKNYIKTTNEIANFVAFFIEYYHILKKLNMEPLSKLHASDPTGPQKLRNTTRQDWRDKVYEAPPTDAVFSEAELLNLINTTVRKKVFFILRGINDPPASILHGVKALHSLFNNFIEEPGYKMRYVWPWYQGLLKDVIPQLVNDLPALLHEGKITEANIVAAEAYLKEFGNCMKTRRELNDSFVMQYATKIMNLIHYVGKLWRMYNPESNI